MALSDGLEERVRKSPKKDYTSLLIDAVSGIYSLRELGILYGPAGGSLTKQRISQILSSHGILSIVPFRNVYLHRQREEKRQKQERQDAEKKEAYCAQFAVLFSLLVEQKGENYALAWRAQKIYHVGKPYALDQLELLIEGRRQGLGYFRCIKYAGIATETRVVSGKLHPIRQILEKALHDIPYNRPAKK